MLKRSKILFSTLSVAAISWSLTSPLAAQDDTGPQRTVGPERYAECMELVSRSPDKAINNALDWRANGGGVPARHCEALALVKIGEPAEGAARLSQIVEDMRVGRDTPIIGGKRVTADAAMLADLYGQAANAWLLAGKVSDAYDAIEAALSVAPAASLQRAELRLDHARIAAADDDFGTAFDILKQLSTEYPDRGDVLILLASASRGVGDFAQAQTALDDFKLLRKANVESPVALLEQAHLYLAQGQSKEAREAYLKVLTVSGESVEAVAARAAIEKLDFKPGS